MPVISFWLPVFNINVTETGVTIMSDEEQDVRNLQRYLLLALLAIMLLVITFLIFQNLYQDTFFNFNSPGQNPLNEWPRYR